MIGADMKQTLKFAAIILLVGLISGCVSKYKTDAYQAPAETLRSNASAYVTMAQDGIYDSKPYLNSGRLVSTATTTAVSHHLPRVEQASKVEDLEEALSNAEKMGLTYVFQPTILHWEDRNTEWSGRPDRITIKVVVWDVTTKQNIASTVLRASSKWATFGGDHPQDLLPGAITPFVDKLFVG
jgi:Domain of unknown function (DUF4823)